jgi:cytochrome c553
MKLNRSHSLRLVGVACAHVALLAIVLSVPEARGAERSSRAAGDLQAKLAYCEDCHGRAAQGFHGYFPIPRLAGQQPEYLKNQLQAFIEHRRTNNIMFNVAHSLSPAMMDALAADFRALDPPPLGGGATRLAPTGEKIFQNGIPEANVAACAACLGP